MQIRLLGMLWLTNHSMFNSKVSEPWPLTLYSGFAASWLILGKSSVLKFLSDVLLFQTGIFFMFDLILGESSFSFKMFFFPTFHPLQARVHETIRQPGCLPSIKAWSACHNHKEAIKFKDFYLAFQPNVTPGIQVSSCPCWQELTWIPGVTRV